MPSAQKMLNRTNLKLPPQYAVEGSTPATYGKFIATNSTWVCPLQLSKLSHSKNPEYVQNKFSGKIANQGKIKVWEENTMTLTGRLLNTTEALGLFTWASTGTADGKQGPTESRTFLYSYIDAAGAEIYVVAKGCKPLSCTLTIPSKDYITIEVEMTAQYVYEAKKPTSDSTGTAIGIHQTQNNLQLEENSRKGITFQDIGDFLYNPTANIKTDNTLETEYDNLAFTDFTSTCTWTPRRQDSNGSDRSLFVDYGDLEVSGSATLYKKGSDLENDAVGDQLRTAIIQLEKEGSTADIHGRVALGGTLGSANQLIAMARMPGTLGNGITIDLIVGVSGLTDTIVKSVIGKKITVNIGSEASERTYGKIASVINADKYASELVHMVAGGTGSVTTTKNSSNSTTGGADNTKKLVFERFIFSPSNEDLLDVSDATMESKSFMADVQHAKV